MQRMQSAQVEIPKKTVIARLVLCIIVLIALASISVNLYAQFAVRQVVVNIKRDLVQENVVGTSSSNAVAFLKRHRFYLSSETPSLREGIYVICGDYYVNEISLAGPYNHDVTVIITLNSSDKVTGYTVSTETSGF